MPSGRRFPRRRQSTRELASVDGTEGHRPCRPLLGPPLRDASRRGDVLRRPPVRRPHGRSPTGDVGAPPERARGAAGRGPRGRRRRRASDADPTRSTPTPSRQPPWSPSSRATSPRWTRMSCAGPWIRSRARRSRSSTSNPSSARRRWPTGERWPSAGGRWAPTSTSIGPTSARRSPMATCRCEHRSSMSWGCSTPSSRRPTTSGRC